MLLGAGEVELFQWLRTRLTSQADHIPSIDNAVRDAAVLIPISLRRSGAQVLFTERARELPHHSGEVSFPGGTIAAGDANPTAAALREVHEEIGVAPHQVQIAGALHPRRTRSGFRVYPIVGIIDANACLETNPAEVAAVFEVPLDFLLEPLNYQRRPVPERSRDRVFNVLEFGSYTIWGVTATILVDLRSALCG